jgi:hypothetical protein
MTDTRDRSEREGRGGRLDGILPDIISKAVASGVRSVFATQEGVRKVVESIPKEVVAFIGEQLDGMRSDIFRILANELHAFLDRVNIPEELSRALTALTLEVTMEVRFKPSERGVKPEVKAKVRAKR